MVVIDLRICRCLQAQLAMLEIVHIVENIRPHIGTIRNIGGERNIVLVHLCIVEGDVPVRRTAAPLV